MKQTFAWILPLAFAASMVGCASTGGATSAVVDPTGMSPQEYENAVYVSRVQSTARQRGIEVMWINPPRFSQKKPEDTQQ